MKKIIYLVLLCVGTFCGAVFYVKKHDDLADMQEKSLLIVVPSYNNKDWYVRNLDSIFNQEYENYHVVYIDDCSPDGTGQLVADYIEQRGFHSKITLVKNEVNKGALYNIYHAIHGHADDNDVILTVDGDDWLAHNHQHNKAYNNVILHVVLEEDRPIFRTSGERIPCLANMSDVRTHTHTHIYIY